MFSDWQHAKWEGEALLRQRKGDAWRPRYVFDCVCWPLLLFCYVYYWSFGSWRYQSWRVAALALLPALGACAGLTWATVLMFRRQVPCRKFLAQSVCLWLGLLLGLWAADQNYGHNMISFYTYQDLVSYTDLDPARAKGQSYMDSGEVYFKEGTEVATAEMVSFRSRSTFCAAPIVGQPLRNQKGLQEVAMEGEFVMPESGTVDFWAVGTDCCDKATRQFTCGEERSQRLTTFASALFPSKSSTADAFASAGLDVTEPAPAPASITVGGYEFADSKALAGQSLKAHGVCHLRYYGLEVCSAVLYLPEGGAAPRSGADVTDPALPKMLELRYCRNFPKDQFRFVTRWAISRNGHMDREVEAGVESFNPLYKDVAAGDCYTLGYDPQGDGLVTLRLNGAQLGSVPGKRFAEAIFAVWFGPRPFLEHLKQELLRARE